MEWPGSLNITNDKKSEKEKQIHAKQKITKLLFMTATGLKPRTT